MSTSLPAFIGIRMSFETSHCLAYNQHDGSLRFNQNDVVSPLTKFAVERSEGDRQLVHLRCCYSNKYLVKHSQNLNWIDASADKPEDQSSLWSSTLFRFDKLGNGDIYTIMHVNTRRYLGHLDTTRLTIDPNSRPTARNHIRLIDWTKIVILPEHITFIGDNDKYLALGNSRASFEFTKEEAADEDTHFKREYRRDGKILIKSISKRAPASGSYMRFVSEKSPIGLSSSGTPFTIFSRSNSEIALQPDTPSGSTLFCKRFTIDSKRQHLFYANINTMTIHTRLQVVEPILSREVRNIFYRFEHVRVHNVEPLILDSRTTRNSTSFPSLRTVGFRYEQKSETTWRGFVSLGLSVKMRFRAGIPVIASTNVTVSGSFEAEYEWGETITETKTLTDNFIFFVPPNSTVTARMVAKKGNCDLPFSYETYDTYYDGSTRRDEIDGGVYTGFNYFDLFRELVMEDGTVSIREPVGTVSLLKDIESGAVSEPQVVESEAGSEPKVMESGPVSEPEVMESGVDYNEDKMENLP